MSSFRRDARVAAILWLGLFCAAAGGATRPSLRSASQGGGNAPQDGGNSETRATPAVLTKVAQVRGLSLRDATRFIPAKLNGVVTALSGYKNSFFLQDGTKGISVDRTDAAKVRVGDLVEVTGTSGAGLFAPIVLASHVVVTGHAAPPRAPRVTFGDLFGGAQDSQWIEVEGIVHSAEISDLFGHDALFLRVEMGGGTMKIILQDFAGVDSSRLIDSTVRVRGVCSTSFNEKRQFVGMGLFVPDRRDIEVLQPAAEDPFAAATTPVRDALQFGQGRHRIKVTGISTYQIPGQALYLQEGSDGVLIQSSSKELVRPGKRVEALGFPVMGDYSPILEDAVFRVVGDAAPVTPLRISADGVIAQQVAFNQVPDDQQLVQLQGKVLDSRIHGAWHIWAMQQGNVVFEARLAMPSSASARMRNVGAGSVLLLTGICTVHADPDRNPISFSILMRSASDIVVVRRPQWWTPGRVIGLIAGLAGSMALVILWVVMLRHRVKQQTRIIRESEERFRHLALHDGLTGLQNRGAILAAVEREMERCRRDGSGLTIMLADIDHFKRVNDTYGHLAGDAALQQFVAAISGSIRAYDHAGRYGGEEFLIALTGVSDVNVAVRVAAFHASITNQTVTHEGRQFSMTCSLGAIYVEPGQQRVNLQQALTLADQALYRAKSDGRNRVVFQTLHDEFPERMELTP